MASSLLSRIPFRSFANASLWNALFDAISGATTAYRLRVNANDDTNAALTLQNLGAGPALRLLSAAGADLLTTYALGMAFNGPVYNVRAYGAVGNSTGAGNGTDDTAAFQAALDAAALTGGRVFVPPSASGNRYRLSGRIRVYGNGVILCGTGRAPLGVGVGSYLLIDHANWPAVLIGGSATTSHYCGVEDLALVHETPVTTTSTYEGNATYGAMVGIDRCGRVLLRNLHIPYCEDFVNVGTTNNPIGSTGLLIHDCEVWFDRFGVACDGCYLVDVIGGHWQDRSPNAGTAFLVRGAGITDGWRIQNLFIESIGCVFRANISSGNVNNVLIENGMFDGVGLAGIWLSPSGGFVGKFDVRGNRFSGAPASTSGYGVLIQPTSTGVVKSTTIADNVFADIGSYGVFMAGPPAANAIHDIDILNNTFKDVSAATTNTYDGVFVADSSVDYRIKGNTITSRNPSDGNRVRYGINQGASNDRFEISGNTVNNAQTGRYNVGTTHAAPDKVWDNGDQAPAYGSATGSTSGPTTTSGSYATLAEMEVTVTTIGGDLEARFDAQWSHSDAAATTTFAFALDGAAEVHPRTVATKVAAEAEVISMSHRFTSVAAGSHTVRVRWLTSAATATAATTLRDLIVREIR